MSDARQQVIRSLTASIEGAADRVRCIDSRSGRPEYSATMRERDLAYAEECLAALIAYEPAALNGTRGVDTLRVLGEARRSMEVAS